MKRYVDSAVERAPPLRIAKKCHNENCLRLLFAKSSFLFLVLFLSVFATPFSAVYLGSSEFSLLVKRIIFFLEFYFREGGHIDLTGVSRNGDSYFSLALAIEDSNLWLRI